MTMNRLHTHKGRNLPSIFYEDDDSLYGDSWEDGYSTTLNEIDRFLESIGSGNKIIELIDIGCDARSPGQTTKIDSSPNHKKINQSKVPKVKKKVPKPDEKVVTRRSGGDTRGTGNRADEYSFFRDADIFKKNGSIDLAVSSSTFVVSDRDIRRGSTNEFDDLLDDFSEIGRRSFEGRREPLGDADSDDDYESDEFRNKKRFIDRAVDSDCLSLDPSKCSIDTKSSILSMVAELASKDANESKNAELLEREETPDGFARTKNVTGTAGSATKKCLPAQESQRKSDRVLSNKTAVLGKNSKERQGVQLKSESWQRRQKPGSTSRNVVKAKTVKIGKKASELSGSVKSSSDNVNEKAHVSDQNFVKRSRLPVWKGRQQGSTVSRSTNKIKKSKDVFENKTEKFKAKNHTKSNLVENEMKDEKLIEKHEEEINSQSLKFNHSKESLEHNSTISKSEPYPETKKKSVIRNCAENEKISPNMETEVSNECKKNVAIKNSAGINEPGKKKLEDQSTSELWNENYEKAYLKGRAVGLKLYRMAKAAREERICEFESRNFDGYDEGAETKLREMPDEVMPLVGKFVDDDGNDIHELDYSGIIQAPIIIRHGKLLSKLNFK